MPFSTTIHGNEGSAKHTSLHCYPGIVHMTPDVSEDLGLETKLADRLAIWTA